MKSALRLIKSYLLLTLGTVIYALAFDAFFVPNGIAFGGITGVAQIIHALFPRLSIGTLVLVFNIPLFLLGWWLLGGHMLRSSLFAMTASSVLIDVLPMVWTFPPMEDTLLACLAGGVTLGVALGIIFLQKATTGGTEIIARLLKLVFGWLPLGKLLLLSDLVVGAAVAVVFGRLEAALYGAAALWLSTFVMDWVLYGMDSAKVAYIISDDPQIIYKAILEELHRGVTFLQGRGGYTGEDKEVILCAFKQRQIVPLKEAVRRADPHAFMIVTSAHEVLGEGFHGYRDDNQ